MQKYARSHLTLKNNIPANSPTEYCFMMTENAPWTLVAPKKKKNNKAMMMIGNHQQYWIGDSGASSHFTNEDSGMFQWTNINEEIGTGDGRMVIAKKRGKL
jgi:hypothetical protein